MRWKRMAVMLVGAGVVFGGVYGFIEFKNQKIAEFFANMPKPVITVTAAKAEQETWNTTVPAVGTLRAVDGVNVTTSVPGRVKEILFTSGQAVKAGDLLVKLDSDIEVANRNATQAEAALAEANYKRVSALPEGSVVSQARIDENLFAMQAAKARVASLDAQISKKSITAPFDGVLGIKQIDVGQYLQPGDKIVNLQNLTTLRVEFSVGQRDIREVVPGRKIRVIADAVPGKVFEGEVSSLEPRVDPATGQVGVEATLPNPEQILRPGMFVNVEVELADDRDVIVVPQEAVSYNLYGDYIYIIEPVKDGEQHPTVNRSVVTPGVRRDGKVVIEKGVKTGQQVVTSGQLKLSNGSQVDVSDVPLTAPDVDSSNY